MSTTKITLRLQEVYFYDTVEIDLNIHNLHESKIVSSVTDDGTLQSV